MGVRVTGQGPAVSIWKGAADAFGRLRISNPVTLFDSQLQYDDAPLLWQTVATGGGSVTHLPNESAELLSTDGTSGALVVRQTKQYFRYQPGKSQLALFTGVIKPSTTKHRARAGLFDGKNGVYVQYDDQGLAIGLRSYVGGSVSDARLVSQANWNIDTGNGVGPSRITIDPSKANIWFVDLQWLGVGLVRVGVETPFGEMAILHEFRNANLNATTYMTTANLPVRWELEATATTTAGSIRQICSAVISEGGFEAERAYHFARAGAQTSVTTRRPVMSIRPALTFNSIENRSLIVPADVSFSVTGAPILWELVYNGTLSGGAGVWTAANASSAVEFNVDRTTITGGLTVAAGHVAAGAGVRGVASDVVRSRLPFTLDYAGTTADVYSLVCTSLAAGAATVDPAIDWTEAR